MSLLTKEQQDDVNTIKNYVLSSLPVHNDQSHDYRMLRHMCMRLLPIIDDLQARAPRQYTEQELRDKFESQFIDWDAPAGQPEWLARVEGAEYVHPHINSEFVGWQDCARKIGALKAEP